MKIILIGYMGAGKTAIGTHLAAKLQLPFIDLDLEINRSEKREIPLIFEQSGEIYFRKKETEVLIDFLDSGPQAYILSVGGGTPCYGRNLELMKTSPGTSLVYLRSSLQTLTQRLFVERQQRPLIRHLDSEELLNDFIRKHLFERSYYYNQSDIAVDTDNKGVEEISIEILRLLK